jgi:hypothetical protein
MNQPLNDTPTDLLDRIINGLENGGCLTDAILDYIEAALFSPEPDRLAAFLIDESDSERDSLLDLIFYPDQAVQIDLEPLIEAARLSVADEQALHGRLMAREIDVRVSMPDGRHLARIRVPDFIRSQYLARLNITWQMNARVAAAIASGVSAARRTMVKVRLRNAGLCPASNQLIWLCRFFERMADSDADYLACLDLVLSILGQAGESVDGYGRLIAHKRFLSRSLQQARRFEALLRHSNMETLMLQGTRAPHVACEALMHEMRLIDLICRRVFGKTEAIDSPREEPLREVTDSNNAGAVIQALFP